MTSRAVAPLLPIEDSASHPAGEHAARPKVLRRPAHFSGTPIAVEISTHLPVSIASMKSAHPPVSSSWQDDARFGLVMLGVVALINIFLMLWLPHMHRNREAEKPYDIHDTSAAERADHKAQVTLFAQPTEEWRTPALYNLDQITAEQNSLSISPQEIPAPRAQALTRDLSEQ